MKLSSAQESEIKKHIVSRIVSHLPQVPPNGVNELMQESLASLGEILGKLSSKREHEQIQQNAQAQSEELRRASAYDGAWAHVLLRARLNGKVIADTEANRQMMESMLAPHETPSSEIYATIALSYPQKFSWQTPKRIQTDAEREAEFKKTCREHWLSECDANRELHKQGVSTDEWAGCCAIERARFEEEAAQARQHRLIHTATPTELEAEAAYEWQTNHDAAVRAESDRRQQYVMSQQAHYPALPTTTSDGSALDAAYLRKISTTDFPLFKRIVRKYGSGNVTARLRGE